MHGSGQVQLDTLSAKLAAGAALLTSDAESAATAASEILDVYPGQPQALFLLVSAIRLMGAEEGARNLIEWMAEEYPNLAAVHYELGLLLARLGDSDQAIKRLSRAVAIEPNHPAAWRALGHQLALAGDAADARKAYVQHARLSLRELKLVEDATAGVGDEGKAENMLRQWIEVSPTDIVARRMLGELVLRMGRLREAEVFAKDALDLAQGCDKSRYLYCTVLTQLMDWKRANIEIQILLEKHPDDPHLESLLVGNLAMRGESDEALRLLEKLRPQAINDLVVWINYALGARSLGLDTKIAIDALQKCLELDPSYGTAWWGLADLKTYRFSPAEVATMRSQLERTDIADGLRCHLEFALGTALETESEYAESFQHFRKGNELRRPYIKYSADLMRQDIMRAKTFFTQEFFAARKNMGCQSPDPIFVVGMPRAGSTLVEQILASHSRVEGTMELPDLGNMVGELTRKHPNENFPNLLLDFDDAAFRKMGEEYLERTHYQRKLGRPFFTDKAGSNFAFIGLIQAILPNAKIIDARRHPLACGFSCYKQAFAPGALLMAYDQTEIGRYYRDYVEAMAHFDKVLPGRVHTVIHERLLENPESEIRRLLAYCGLPFEEACLRSHETERSVRTSSSEQVRQPIRKKKVETWRRYDAWLQQMKDVLGDVLTNYPDVPAFD
ncbi:MAG TPA: sulfotransferase [Rhizomicrobium sp.]|nr:sulfotransferase [Rhizomicrobium sp.]